MKAERRHELQENTLARSLTNLPLMARLYADKILLVLVIILAIVVLVRWRINASRERIAGATDALSSARTSITELGRVRLMTPQQTAEFRSNARTEIENALRTVSSDAPQNETTLRSEALLAKADLLWTLASLPEIPGAATQPSLKFAESRDDFLKQAEDTYQQLLTTYGNIPRMKASALFGLAAIKEDRRNFEAASQDYFAIKQSDLAEMYKQLAEERLKMLPEMQNPKLFGTLTTKPTSLSPATQPVTTQPATSPS